MLATAGRTQSTEFDTAACSLLNNTLNPSIGTVDISRGMHGDDSACAELLQYVLLTHLEPSQLFLNSSTWSLLVGMFLIVTVGAHSPAAAYVAAVGGQSESSPTVLAAF